MTYSELKKTVTEITQLQKSEVSKVLDTAIETIAKKLSNGNSVNFGTIGSLNVKQRKERYGVNPRTKERIYIPAQKTVKLNPTSAIKKAVNNQ